MPPPAGRARGRVRARAAAAAAPRAPQRGLVADGRAFRETFRVRGREVDARTQRLRPAELNAMFQEVAVGHAAALWGAEPGRMPADPLMRELGLAFVLAKIQLRFGRLPGYGEEVQVETWFHPAGKAGARRDFAAVDPRTGATLGAGTSTWLLFNLNTRRLARIPKEMLATFDDHSPAEERFALEEMAGGAAGPPPKEAKFPAFEGPPQFTGPAVRAAIADLDATEHVNNLVYMDWMLAALPEARARGEALVGMEIEYRNEVRLGDGLESLASEISEAGEAGADAGARTYLHSLRRLDGAEVTRARSRWAAVPA